jgi:hypothetical protein
MEYRLANEHDPLVSSALEWLTAVDNYQPADYAEFEERYSLAALFFQTGGNRLWNFKTGWLTSTTACGWYGVTCTSAGKVAGIELSENSLVGTLPSELGILSAMTSITIFGSFELTGSIPTQFSRLTNLRRITMSTYSISSALSWFWFCCWLVAIVHAATIMEKVLTYSFFLHRKQLLVGYHSDPDLFSSKFDYT